MSIKKLMLVGLVTTVAMLQVVAFANISVSDVEVFSGYPWQEVVIGYKITGSEDRPKTLKVMAKDCGTGKTYVCKTLEGVGLTPGNHVVKWNASADGAKFKSEDIVFTVRIVPQDMPALSAPYCVIDLSGEGVYPVTGLADVPSGGWTDEYKTTKLVLRRIEAGKFTMGSTADTDNQPHQVTLTKPFYVGVFEVTQRQWELVTSRRPSYFSNDSYYASRPVEQVTYDMIRGSWEGASWPTNNVPDGGSFLGVLRERTGLRFDLPTEAQWEYACRAGTTSDYNNGGSSEDDLRVLGRYWDNGGSDYSSSCTPLEGTATVGSYRPNAWGLYDMHGNVMEWCLDWHGSIGAATDPKGAITGSARVYRGGAWFIRAWGCTASRRTYSEPSVGGIYIGFRISLSL